MNIPPSLIFDQRFNSAAQPEISVVIPFFNQSKLIPQNLRALVSAMATRWELILIDDASRDGSSKAAIDAIRSLGEKPRNLTRVRLYQNRQEYFETECDSFGFSVAEADFFLEVQIDMEVNEKGFDRKLLDAISAWDDLLMVSGRGTEPFENALIQFEDELKILDKSWVLLFLIYLARRIAHSIRQIVKCALPKTFLQELKFSLKGPAVAGEPVKYLSLPDATKFSETGRAGRLGILIEEVISPSDLDRRLIWLGETVMRGPLIVSRELYTTVGGLNSESFVLGLDDCELAAAGFLGHQLRCGFVPIGFHSPLKAGSTRKGKSFSTWIRLTKLKRTAAVTMKETALYHLLNSETRDLPLNEVRSF